MEVYAIGHNTNIIARGGLIRRSGTGMCMIIREATYGNVPSIFKVHVDTLEDFRSIDDLNYWQDNEQS
jgi:hypothetical protein